ncbi:hypothetical protein C0389_05470 [bacterium]|nr:hypothetical protein [bacterium]
MITKILFVASSPETVGYLSGLQESQKESLEFFFENNCVDALKSISENNISIVITDFRIPKFNYQDFFNLLQMNYPRIFRLSLASSHEKDNVLRLSKSIHRYVKLPLSKCELLKTINDLIKLLSTEIDAELVEKINGLGPIPILPEIYLRLEKEISRSTFSMNRIAEIIQSDPLMVARLLHIAHSSFYSIPTGISNLLQALTFLGVDVIKTLVLYVKIFSLKNVSPETQSLLKEIKAHSINVAKLSKAIMQKETDDKKMIELAYISGLLHDIGKIILLQLNDKEQHQSYLTNIRSGESYRIEMDLFGVSHVKIGAYILRLWGLNDTIIEAVASHHDKSLLDGNTLALKEIVYIANVFSHEIDERASSISESYGTQRFDQWDQLFKEDIRPALNLSL